MAEQKLSWLCIWRRAGGRPGTVMLHASEVGNFQKAQDATRSGNRSLEILAEAGLIQILARERGTWTIYVNDPIEVENQHGLRRIDPDPQAELFEEETASTPPSTPGKREDVLEEVKDLIPISHGVDAASNAESPESPPRRSRLDDPAYVQTVDGLTELWLHTCKARVGGRSRDRIRDIKPMVQETVKKAGVPLAEIAEAMRTRINTMEWYTQFHQRLLPNAKRVWQTAEEIERDLRAEEAAKGSIG